MRLPLTLAVTAALALPASAMAKTKYYIPPGNSSGSEYVESVPTAGGNSPTSKIGGGQTGGGQTGSSHAGGGTLSQHTQSALKKFGTAGAQTAAFASATGPAGQPSGVGGSGAGGARASGGSSGSPGGASSGGAGGPGASGRGASSTGSASGSDGSSPGVSVARSVTGLGGHGGFGLLPLALIVAALGICAIALRRRHAS